MNKSSELLSTTAPHPPREVLDRERAYIRVDQAIVRALPELGEAIRSFKPVAGPAGESVADWLAKDALREPQESSVRLRLSHGRVTGVYALCAAQILLDAEERAQLGGLRYRTQPAVLLAQFARSSDAPGIGEELLRHADGTARLALPYIGASVLVVDPLDAPTAKMWRERFGFRESSQPVPGNRRLRRHWLNLQA